MTNFSLTYVYQNMKRTILKSYLKSFQILDTRKDISKGFVHELIT